MHMADALLSPTTGAAFWATSSVAMAWCARRLRTDSREHLVPLMGVLGAFVFAAQMINFTIPGTGSSGHIGGGMLLSILLGGPAAFVVIASVLSVQALIFADGGLLALGANVFNLGVFPCFIAYPLIFKPLLRASGTAPTRRRFGLVTVLATVVGLQLGALGVVIETRMSGISSLPLGTFLLLMQPIHLAIGIVEGLATAAVVGFLREARPDLLEVAPATARPKSAFPTRIVALIAVSAVLTGGVFSWFASSAPDGLEWSIEQVTGKAEVDADDAIHQALSRWQTRIAPMPDYQFAPTASTSGETEASEAEPTWPAIDAGTSMAGVLGGVATLLIVIAIGYLLRPQGTRVAK